jgi:hypothetical protein
VELPFGSGGVKSVLFPLADDGTNNTNAVTPAAPAPLSTAELVNADRSVDFRRRVGTGAGRVKTRAASARAGAGAAFGRTLRAGAIRGT